MSNWKFREKIEDKDTELFGYYPDIIAKVLFHRGIKTKEEARRFFDPKYEEDLNDPFLMKDMMKAALRIVAAINNKERIVVYADYDCDGIPAATILHDLFKKIGFNNFEVYIPHRHSEGYGMNINSVRELCARGADLFVTVDCGINDFEAVEEARALGADVIITDHHETKEKLPDAFAVVDPKRADDKYPEKMLSGSGVAFKLAQAIIAIGNFNISPGWEKWLLDMAGLGTLADMVPLLGENRAISQFGLSVLRKTKRPGLQNLYHKNRINPAYLCEEDVGFAIAPRINAASRMGVPSVAFTFVSTTDPKEAEASFCYLEDKNLERKASVEEMMKAARKNIFSQKDKDILFVGQERWNPGILGLIAGRLAEEFKKTVFVWGGEGECLKGSCRSNGTVSIVELMSSIPGEIFYDFGGHHMAGGFSLNRDFLDVAAFQLNSAYCRVSSALVNDEIFIDDKLEIEDVDWGLFDSIERMAPFGIGNPRPVFLFEGVQISGIKQFGKKGDHLQIEITKDGEKTISAYSFFKNKDSFGDDVLKIGKTIDLIATIDKNNFGRLPSLRLRIVDISRRK